MATYREHYATEPSFYVPVVAAAGALSGLLVGNAQGSGIIGFLLGAVLLGGIGYYLGQFDNERLARWGLAAVFVLGGFALGGLPGAFVGGFFGWFFGWFSYWLARGRYRRGLAPYLTPGQVLWYYSFRVICGAIFVFLITPILVVMPLSFNAQDFFTFTPEMLQFRPEGYSLKHYDDFFTNSDWQNALRNSLIIAPAATV
ncbi:MAG: ABC transporter permease, partial [Pseudomonadota bacterium]